MTDIHDIRPPLEFAVDPRFSPCLLCALAGLLVLAAIILLLVFLKRRKQARATPEAIIPPDRAALERLRTLKLDDLIDGKSFYIELSSIFRGYLEGRFHLDALEMTSEELLPEIMKMDLGHDLIRGVREFVDGSDPVKFAGKPPVREHMQKDLRFIEHFILATALRENDDSQPAADV